MVSKGGFWGDNRESKNLNCCYGTTILYLGMTEIEIECNEAFADRGGIVSSDKLMEDPDRLPLITLCRDIEEELNSLPDLRKKIPQVHVCIISSIHLSASATKYNGKYFIGIHYGTFSIIQGLFYRMLSCPSAFKGYGDPSKEVPIEKIQNLEFTNMIEQYNRVWDDVLPRDPDRLEIGKYYTSLALQTLVYHELGHIVRGHLDYQNSNGGGYSFSENVFDKEQDKSMSPMLRQVLELDADLYAIKKMIKRMKMEIDEQELTDEQKEIRVTNQMANIAIVVYSIFKIFGTRVPESELMRKSKYPSAGTRQLNSILAISDFFARAKQRSEPWGIYLIDVVKSTGIGLTVVEDAFLEISNQEFDKDQTMLNKLITDHHKNLEKQFVPARRMLKKYAYD
jgi:hypothetical protein